MTITYAGVPVEPPNGGQEAVDRYWHGHRIAEFEYPGYVISDTDHLPLPTAPACGPPAVGRLRWPTGASRWATCHLIATLGQTTAIRTALGAGAGALVLSDGTSAVTAASMWLLPPRPIAQRDLVGVPSDLYLLTLVDDRWWWWQAPGLQTSPSTWDGLITNLLALVGVTPAVQDPAPADYGAPWAGRWDRVGKPLPLLLDAACKTVGLSVVRALDGTVSVQNSATAAASDEASWAALQNTCLAGGRIAATDTARVLPASVAVVFPGEPPDVATVALPAGVAGKVGRLVADMSAVDLVGQPAYAAQAAADYYAWQAYSRTDATLRGFQSYAPAGVHDAVEYAHAPDQLVTRVFRLAWDDHLAEGGVAPPLFFPAQITAPWDPVDGYAWARLTEDTAPPSYGAALPAKTGLNLVEVAGRTNLRTNTRVFMWRNPDGAGWGCQVDLVGTGCGLKYDEPNNEYYVDPNDFAGSCLLVDNTNPVCPILYVDPACVSGSGFTVDCGLTWAGGVLSVDPAPLVGAPEVTSLVVVPGEGACAVGVDLDVAFEQDWVRHAITFFGRVAGGKLRLCYTIYVDTDQYNVAGLYLNHVIGDGANVCREVDICDPDCCTECTITFSVSVSPSSGSAPLTTTLTVDTLSGCTGPYTVTLDWGDGTVETHTGATAGAIYTHTYNVAGTYHVTADAYDACGYAGSAADVTVTATGGAACTNFSSVTLYLTTDSAGGPSDCLGTDLHNDPLVVINSTTQGVTHGPGLPTTPDGFSVTVICVGDGTYQITKNTQYSGPPLASGFVSSGGPPGSGTFHLTRTYTDSDTTCTPTGKTITIHIRDFTVP